jgi:hypothetical protein
MGFILPDHATARTVHREVFRLGAFPSMPRKPPWALPRPFRLSLRPAVAMVGDFQMEMVVRPDWERGQPSSDTGRGRPPGQGERDRCPA